MVHRPEPRAAEHASDEELHEALFVLNIVGLGLGPSLVGALNDALAPQHGDFAVRYSLLLVALVGGLASVFFWIGSASLREDLVARDA